MFRYIAFAWNCRNGNASLIAADLSRRAQSLKTPWRIVFSRVGLVVLVADAGAPNRVLAHQVGVVLGVLFSRSTMSPVQASAIESESERIVATAGRELVLNYWGRYVSFIHDPGSQTTWILRDPMGQFPALHTSFKDVHVYFSYLPDLLELGGMPLSIKWSYIAAHTVATMVQSGETALAEVTEVLPGECVKLTPDSQERLFYWNPFEIANTDIIANQLDAEERLYVTARQCVRTWASCYENVLLRLSGGLDSSIVAACLSDIRGATQVACFHLFTPDGNCDEREYARLASVRSGLRLIERRAQKRVRLESILEAAPCPKPFPYLGPDAADGSDDAARESGASAIFTGEGGDQLFYQHPILLSAVDYFYTNGARIGGFKVALDAAVSDSVSLWKVLGQCVRLGLLKRRDDPLGDVYRSTVLVGESTIEQVRRADPLKDPRRSISAAVPPGKTQHIFRLSFGNFFYDPMGRADCPEPVNPLKSQPLVEMCLRIPTYVLATAGRDRAVARQAFARDLPAAIVERHAKGDADLYVKRIVNHNIAFVRELLLEGLLVDRGLLDRRKLEQALSDDPSRLSVTIGEIIHHLATEAWLRSWTARTERNLPRKSALPASTVMEQIG